MDDLNEEEKESLFQSIKKISFQFKLKNDKLGSTPLVYHRITTTDNQLVISKVYRPPQIHKEEIAKQCKDLLDNGGITLLNSPYNSPVWVIPKKLDLHGNKKWIMVIGYRKLNEKTVGDACPLPNITDILDQLGGAKYVSVLDLASVFIKFKCILMTAIKPLFLPPLDIMSSEGCLSV